MSTVVPIKTRRTVEQARMAILEAAEEVVREVGPAGLRITAVAKRAKMAHPNVIHHFGSREGLLNALATRVMQRSTDRVITTLAESLNVGPEEHVEAMVRVLDSVYSGDDGRVIAWLVLSDRIGDFDPPDLEPLVQLVHAWRTSAVGDFPMENTRQLIMLATHALMGNAISGKSIADSLNLGGKNQPQFTRWFAEFLLDQLAPK